MDSKSLKLSSEDYWRSIILYGRATATYKMAVGQIILTYSQDNVDKIDMYDVAEDFLKIYQRRLINNKPQLGLQGRRTVVEWRVKELELEKINRNKAIEDIRKHSLIDMVLPKFHTVGKGATPVKFYEFDEKSLQLTNDALMILGHDNSEKLKEVLSRWDLLESAFESISLIDHHYVDIEREYIQKGYPRKNITSAIDAFRGYQQNKCFYCGETLYSPIHVDHVIPRSHVQHDEMWNLVLAHEFCNEQKLDNLPAKDYIDNLILRNEGLIKSNHPLKNTLIKELGNIPLQRKRKVLETYSHAKMKIKRFWRGSERYIPKDDLFYRKIVRALSDQSI